jgi:hypothetical protein
MPTILLKLFVTDPRFFSAIHSLPSAPSPAQQQLQTSSQVLAAAKALLASCPTSRYILVSQPNLHAADLRDNEGDGCRLPNLCRAVRQLGAAKSWSVAEVIGQVSGRPLEEYIAETCAQARGGAGEVKVERVELRHLPAVGEGADSKRDGKRREVLGDNGMSSLHRTLEDSSEACGRR